jgi:hypothetical protein
MKCAILDTDVGTNVDDALALALIAFPKCYDNRYRPSRSEVRRTPRPQYWVNRDIRFAGLGSI